MRKDLDNARESGPPVLPERKRTFFVAKNLKWGYFRGQGMDKRRVQPLARGAYYIGLYDEIFLGDRSLLFRIRPCSIFMI